MFLMPFFPNKELVQVQAVNFESEQPLITFLLSCWDLQSHSKGVLPKAQDCRKIFISKTCKFSYIGGFALYFSDRIYLFIPDFIGTCRNSHKQIHTQITY